MTTTAIILSARKERDSEVPYPLMAVDRDGTTPMARTLDILRSLGYSRIVIVTGYRADDFKTLAAPDVHFVSNPDYAYTGSMASLAAAACEIDGDFLLVESDVVCERRVYEELTRTEEPLAIAVADERGRSDEALIETYDGCIVNISKDPHVLNSINGEMIGISRISNSAFRRMMLAYEDNSNPLLNYEYLLLRATSSCMRRCIRFDDLVWGEIDNVADFDYIYNTVMPLIRRRENPFDRLNIISHLRSVMPDRNIPDDVSIVFLGGMTNRSFKVEIDGDQYVLRVAGAGTEGMIDRANEAVNAAIGCDLGLTPELLHINSRTGLKLCRYIPGAETMTQATIQRYSTIRQVAQLLRRLHTSGVRLQGEFNVFDELERYDRLMHEGGAEMYEGYEKIKSCVPAISALQNRLGVCLCPCHNDLTELNFVKDNTGRLYLIDWEYAGMNDPMWDIADLLREADFTPDNRSLFLDFYYEGRMRPDNLELRLLLNTVMMDLLWSVWTVVKEKSGDDFGDYGQKRFARCKENFKLLKPYLNIE